MTCLTATRVHTAILPGFLGWVISCLFERSICTNDKTPRRLWPWVVAGLSAVPSRWEVGWQAVRWECTKTVCQHSGLSGLAVQTASRRETSPRDAGPLHDSHPRKVTTPEASFQTTFTKHAQVAETRSPKGPITCKV